MSPLESRRLLSAEALAAAYTIRDLVARGDYASLSDDEAAVRIAQVIHGTIRIKVVEACCAMEEMIALLETLKETGLPEEALALAATGLDLGRKALASFNHQQGGLSD